MPERRRHIQHLKAYHHYQKTQELMLNVDDLVTKKHHYKKYPLGIRTGNTLHYGKFKYLRRNTMNRLVKWTFLHNKYEENEAKTILKSDKTLVDDGGLLANFCNYPTDMSTSQYFQYSLNKKYRWKLPNLILHSNKDPTLKSDKHTVCYVEKRANELYKTNNKHNDGLTFVSETIPSVTSYCDENGNIKRPNRRKYCCFTDLKPTKKERTVTEDVNNDVQEPKKPIDVLYEVCKTRPFDSHQKSKNRVHQNYVCNLNNKILRSANLKKRRNVPLSKTFRDIIKEDREDVYYTRPNYSSYKPCIQDSSYSCRPSVDMTYVGVTFQTKNKNNKRKRKEKSKNSNKFDDFYERKSKIIFLDNNPNSLEEAVDNKIVEPMITEIKTEFYDKDDHVFEFTMPLSYKDKFIQDCTERDLSVINGQTCPPMLLMDFSERIREIYKKFGGLSNLDKLRGLLHVTFWQEDNACKIKYVLRSNLKLDNRITVARVSCLSLEMMLENIEEVISREIIPEDYYFKSKMENPMSYNKIDSSVSDWIMDYFNISRKTFNISKVYQMKLNEYWLKTMNETIKERGKEIKFPTKNSNMQMVCEICTFDDNIDSGISLKCGHWFCIDCWQRHLLNAKVFTCPMYKCKEKVELPLLFIFFNFEKFCNLEKRIVDNILQKEKSWHFCQSPLCNQITNIEGNIKLPIMECSCSRRWCIECGDDYHWPSTCKQNKVFWHQAKVLGVSGHRGTSDAIFVVQVKTCPSCNRKMQKHGGCNYMFCFCGKGFCWECLKDWDSGGNHYNCHKMNNNFENVALVDNGLMDYNLLQRACSSWKNLLKLRRPKKNNLSKWLMARWILNSKYEKSNTKQLPWEKMKTTATEVVFKATDLCLVGEYITSTTIALAGIEGRGRPWKSRQSSSQRNCLKNLTGLITYHITRIQLLIDWKRNIKFTEKWFNQLDKYQKRLEDIIRMIMKITVQLNKVASEMKIPYKM